LTGKVQAWNRAGKALRRPPHQPPLATALTLGGARLLLSFAFGRELALGLGCFASARDLLLLRERRFVARKRCLERCKRRRCGSEPTR
jgi:hypothetical protein